MEEKKLGPIYLESLSKKERLELEEYMTHTGPIWTVCEIIRNIYVLASKIDDPVAKEIMDKAQVALLMTKKMNSKLREYKSNYDEGWWNNKEEK